MTRIGARGASSPASASGACRSAAATSAVGVEHELRIALGVERRAGDDRIGGRELGQRPHDDVRGAERAGRRRSPRARRLRHDDDGRPCAAPAGRPRRSAARATSGTNGMTSAVVDDRLAVAACARCRAATHAQRVAHRVERDGRRTSPAPRRRARRRRRHESGNDELERRPAPGVGADGHAAAEPRDATRGRRRARRRGPTTSVTDADVREAAPQQELDEPVGVELADPPAEAPLRAPRARTASTSTPRPSSRQRKTTRLPRRSTSSDDASGRRLARARRASGARCRGPPRCARAGPARPAARRARARRAGRRRRRLERDRFAERCAPRRARPARATRTARSPGRGAAARRRRAPGAARAPICSRPTPRLRSSRRGRPKLVGQRPGPFGRERASPAPARSCGARRELRSEQRRDVARALERAEPAAQRVRAGRSPRRPRRAARPSRRPRRGRVRTARPAARRAPGSAGLPAPAASKRRRARRRSRSRSPSTSSIRSRGAAAPRAMRLEHVLDGMRVLGDRRLLHDARGALERVREPQQPRARAPPPPAFLELEQRPCRAPRPARAPRRGSTCRDPAPSASRRRACGWTSRSSSSRERRELRRRLQRLARARLGLLRRLRDVRDRDVDLLDRGRLLLRARARSRAPPRSSSRPGRAICLNAAATSRELLRAGVDGLRRRSRSPSPSC